VLFDDKTEVSGSFVAIGPRQLVESAAGGGIDLRLQEDLF
jgi:hypothetical protein